MTTKQVFVTLFCVVLFAKMGYSQINTATLPPQPTLEEIIHDPGYFSRRSDAERVRDEETFKESFRSEYWGNVEIRVPGYFMESWRDPEFRATLGVSDEYYQQIQVSESNARGRVSDVPEYQKAQQERNELFRAVWGVELGSNAAITGLMREERERNAGTETLNRLRELGARIELMEQEFLAGANQREAEAFDNALTPELKQKFREVPLAVMALGETPDFLPSAFSALNLTGTQREQMERIKKELEPELERHLQNYVEGNVVIFVTGTNAFHKAVNAAREAELRGVEAEGVFEIRRRLLMEDSEYQEALDKVNSSAKAFAKLFTSRMSEILNDEQRKRLQDLTDNPPEYVRIHIQRLREQRNEKIGANEEGKSGERAAGDKEMWVPGPGSWKPGDPIPGVPLERNTRRTFPRGEN